MKKLVKKNNLTTVMAYGCSYAYCGNPPCKQSNYCKNWCYSGQDSYETQNTYEHQFGQRMYNAVK